MMKAVEQSVYGTRLGNGRFWGEINKRDMRRYELTATHILNEINSVLDIGCFCGEWLGYLQTINSKLELAGVDVSQDKIIKAKEIFPNIKFECGYAESLGLAQKSFDLITCLEVLEHIPDWQHTFQSLFNYAKRQVLISVPYNEKIVETVCIHCGKITPLYGHLHAFEENCFPEVNGWIRTVSRIRFPDPQRSFIYKIYKYFAPNPGWMLINYTSNNN